MKDYEFVGRSDANFDPPQALSVWETYRNHRDIVTGFIRSSASANAETLCVLGAGHCRDIELNELAARFSNITLVDLNESDVMGGLKNQNLDLGGRLEVIGGLDLCGVFNALCDVRDHQKEETLESIIHRASTYVPKPLGVYDCIASTCVLSQLLFHATECVSERHPKFVDLLQTIRMRHIEIMLNCLKPGGNGLLVTDFVSTESLPELFETTDLKQTLRTAVADKNFLHGLNPAVIDTVFQHEKIKPQLKSIKITEPWRWAMPGRIYACFAIIFKKNSR